MDCWSKMDAATFAFIAAPSFTSFSGRHNERDLHLGVICNCGKFQIARDM